MLEEYKEQISKYMSENKYHEAYNIAENLINKGIIEPEILIIWAKLSYLVGKINIDKINFIIRSLNLCKTNIEKVQLSDLISGYYCMIRDFSMGFYWKHKTMVYLIEELKEGRIPKYDNNNSEKKINPEVVNTLAFKIASKFHENKIPATFMFGTLLGIVRDGKVIEGDKDIDFTVWQEYFIIACHLLANMGYKRSLDINFDNFATFVDPETMITVDLMGLRREPEKKRIVGGFLSYDKPQEWQHVRIFPWFSVIDLKINSYNIFYPDNPEKVLESIYSERWKIPDPDWVPFIHSQGYKKSALHRLYVYVHILKNWISGKVTKTHNLIRDALNIYPDDTTLMESLYLFNCLLRGKHGND